VATSASQKVEGVLCGYLTGAPTLQAVVKVRYGGTDGLLDIDVYTNIAGTTTSRIFRLKGLPHGNVGISNYNTLLTAEIDPMPSQNAAALPHQRSKTSTANSSGRMAQERSCKWLFPASTPI